jgi:hypothetical protein
MRQFLLVVRTGSDPHRRGWLLPHVSDSPVRFQVAADQAARKHVGDSRNRGWRLEPSPLTPALAPAHAADGDR